MKHILLFLLSLLSVVPAMAQKLDVSILSFELDPFATTAQAGSQYAEYDKGGELYAIIKVKDAEGNAMPDGFTFNFGSVRTLKHEIHDDELWVWVQRNAKAVTIRHSKYKTIEKYDLGQTIQPGKTYIMRMAMDRTEVYVKHEIRKQGLQFEVSPANEHAIVKVKTQDAADYELWGEVDVFGKTDRNLDFGTYDYVVSAENYEPSYGRVTLSDNKNTHVEKVTLKPNFGFLEVTGDYGCNGADVYINDRKVGTIPYKSNRMECRTDYRIAVTQGDLYKPYNTTFAIRQGETTRLAPELQSNFAQTTLRVDNGAEIYVDGALKGSGSWTGPLKAGQYTINCKKANHRESSKSITVRPDVTETFDLPAPIPITGSLYVRSTPSGATVSIDGREYGKTPLSISDVLIGQHTVSISLSNYKTESRSVTVQEGKQETVDVTLSDFAMMTIASRPTAASLYIDGKYVSTTPHKQEMPSGDYKIRLTKKGYHDYEKTIHLDSSNPSVMLTMHRQYQQKSSFYLQPTFQISSTMCVGGVIGGYIAGVNIEAGYMMGLGGQDIYWNNLEGEAPKSETLKSSAITARLGYGIIVGTRFRITPQLGANVVNVKGDISQSNATAATIGCRADYALTKNFGLSLTPEYGFSVQKSDTYQRLMDVGVKDVASGFNVKAGITIFF